MKLKNPLLAVRDMERSKTFYREVLGLHVVMDFGANVTLTGGLCLQTLDTWTDFLGKEAEEIRFGANDSEVYFEEDDFDGFLASCDTIVMGRKASWRTWLGARMWCTSARPWSIAGGSGWCGSMTRTATSLRWVRI